MESRICPFCNKVETAINPLFIIDNAGDFDPKEVCKECSQMYDNTFGWDGDLLVYL